MQNIKGMECDIYPNHISWAAINLLAGKLKREIVVIHEMIIKFVTNGWFSVIMDTV